MKQLILIIFLLLPPVIHAQQRNTIAHETMFYKLAEGAGKKYTYTLKDGQLNGLSCSWTSGNTARTLYTTQSFTLYNGQLTEAYEKIIYVYNKKDSAIWACSYYFKDGRLADMSSLGHGKSEDDSWEPEKEVLDNYKQAAQQVTWHRNRSAGVVVTSALKRYYPDGLLWGVYHNGRFNGTGISVGTDSIFYRTGELRQTIYHDHAADKKDPGGHATWTTLEQQEFFKDGSLMRLAFLKTCYECSECNCGHWSWYSQDGTLIKEKKYGDCYDQRPCAD